jgi:hypothetical protein
VKINAFVLHITAVHINSEQFRFIWKLTETTTREIYLFSILENSKYICTGIKSCEPDVEIKLNNILLNNELESGFAIRKWGLAINNLPDACEPVLGATVDAPVHNKHKLRKNVSLRSFEKCCTSSYAQKQNDRWRLNLALVPMSVEGLHPCHILFWQPDNGVSAIRSLYWHYDLKQWSFN